MSIDFGKAADKFSAVMSTNGGGNDSMMGGGVFHVVCRDAQGNVKWEENFHNKVPSVGLQYMNNSFFAATGYTTALYFGLITGPGPSTFAASDTLGSHAWTENTAYSGNRKAATFTSASNNTPSITTGTAPVFTMTGPATIAGAFVCNVATTNSGILFAEGDFAADKVVTTDDTLNVTYQFSLTSA